jgi:hypothetical protein
MKLNEILESISYDYNPGMRPANDSPLPHNYEEIASAVQEYIERGENPSTAAEIIADEFGVDTHKVIDSWHAAYNQGLKEAKNATQVRILDQGKEFLYWVPQSNPKIAKRAALKKHRARFGYGMKVGSKYIEDKPLDAEIIKRLHNDSEPETSPEPMPELKPDTKYA